MIWTLGLPEEALIGDSSLPSGFLGDTTGTRCGGERGGGVCLEVRRRRRRRRRRERGRR